MASSSSAASLQSAAAALFSPKALPKSTCEITLLPSKLNRNSAFCTLFSPPLQTQSIKLPFPTHFSAASSALDSSSTPSPATLKSRLEAGETLYGLFLLSASPTLAEIAGLAGYDFVVVDMEHGQGGLSEALSCMRALAASGTAAILRLPESSPMWAKKALDLGPQGIMFPLIENAGDAEKAISYCRYPPKGIRGAAHPVVRASGYGIDDGYLRSYEDELLVMVQVETGRAMEEIEAIAAVDGIDAIQMGPLDLSASLGYLWKPGHRKVREVLEAAERKVLEGRGKRGAYLGGFAMPHDPPEEMMKRGYHMVSGAVDVAMFRKAAVEDVRKFKNASGLGGDSGGEVDGDEEDKGYWSE